MAARVDKYGRIIPIQKPRVEPKQVPAETPKPVKPQPNDRLLRNFIYGDMRRSKLESLLPAGTAGLSTGMMRYRGEAFRQASGAYRQVMNDGIKAGNVNLTELTNKAVTAYENTLRLRGVNPSEAPSFSIVNQLNMMNGEGVRGGNLFTLDQNVMRSLVGDENPKVFTRMLWVGPADSKNPTGPRNIDLPDSRLAYYDASKKTGKTIAWSTTPEDLMGSRMDYQEVMRRIGWTADDIAKAKPEDFKLVVFTEESAADLRIPTNDNIIETARTDANNFKAFQGKGDDFWQKVVSYDYQGALADAKKSGTPDFTDYANNLPPDLRDVALARQTMEKSMGVNPLFTGEGFTMRPDDINGRVGGREFITNNTVDRATLFEMAQRGQIAFVDLQDQGITPKTPVEISPNRVTAPQLTRTQMLFSETKMGGLAGAGFSAFTSSFDVYDKIKAGDYTGAATTFGSSVALGGGTGAFSSAAENIIGNRITDGLANSNLAQRGLDRLYQSGAARNVVSRFAGTEASNITSSTFGSAARSLAGRVGGAGVVGGIVNGGFAAYDQYQAYQRGEVTASQAIGTVVGEAGVGFAAGAAGAAAGAAIGSIIPGAGTVVGGAIGFVAGMVVGAAVDWGARQLGVDKALGQGVTAMIDGGIELAGKAQAALTDAGESIGNAVESVGNALNDVGNSISGGLKSVFGW